MQQMKEPPAPAASRRLPPRRRSIGISDPEVESLGARMDRLEEVLRRAVRANKEVLRTLDPERGDAAQQRRELAAFGERVKEGLTGVARVVRSELRATEERQEAIQRDIEDLRSMIELLSRRLESSDPPAVASVTRLSDVRARLARVADELDEAAGRL